MRWFYPMSGERASVVLSDAELDQARELVIGVLDIVLADPGRLKDFLKDTAFDPEAAHTLAKQPTFMLSVLDTAARNEELLAALEREAGIAQAFIELTQARLAFHVAAELGRQGESLRRPSDMGDRARQKLRELSRPEKSGELSPEHAPKKIVSGNGGQ
jgi:hypothetical protein